MFLRLVLLAAGLTLLAGRPALGQTYTFAVNHVTAAAGSTGNVTLEVTLTYTGIDPSPSIGAFSFGLSAGGAGVSFTGVSEATTSAGYIFGGSGLGILGIGLPGTQFSANDLHAVSGVVLTSGQTVGLGRVTFDVSPTATVGVPVEINLPLDDISLTDASAMPINPMHFAFVGGSVTPVPEPGTGLLVLAGFWLCSRRIYASRSFMGSGLSSTCAVSRGGGR